MPEEYFTVTAIAGDPILHGRAVRVSPDGRREFVRIEQKLSPYQADQYRDLILKNDRTIQRKLEEIAGDYSAEIQIDMINDDYIMHSEISGLCRKMTEYEITGIQRIRSINDQYEQRLLASFVDMENANGQ